MLTETIKQMVFEKLDTLMETTQYRTKDLFHTSFKKNRISQLTVEHKLSQAKANFDTKGIRKHKQRLDDLHAESDTMASAADHHHGMGSGDALRDHAHMEVENPHDYHKDQFANIRKTHGLKTNPNYQNPNPPAPSQKKPPVQKKQKQSAPDVADRVFRGTYIDKIRQSFKQGYTGVVGNKKKDD